MAFGIDDALSALAAGISLTDTVVRTVQGYQRRGVHIDLEILFEEVRTTALKRIDESDSALSNFERMLVETGVDINKKLIDVIGETPFWKAGEQHRLSQIQRSFHAMSDSVYSATDDIAALVRCSDQTRPMGEAVVESAKAKHELHSSLLHAPSLRAQIELLRNQLVAQKSALMGRRPTAAV